MARLEIITAVSCLALSLGFAEPGIEHYSRQLFSQLQLESPNTGRDSLLSRGDFSIDPPLPSLFGWPNSIDGGIPPIPAAERDKVANWSLVGGAALLTGSILLFIDSRRINSSRI